MGWSSWVHGGSLGVGKVKADELEMRNLMRSPMHGDRRDTWSFANLGQSVRMWFRYLIDHIGMRMFPEGKTWLYIGAWFKI